MALFFKSKVLLAKIETTYGTPIATVGSDAILAKDIKIMPMEGSDVDRDLEQPYFGSQGTIPVDLHSKITFDVELAGSGTAGTVPAWGSLMRACGCAEVIEVGTSVAYNPVTLGHEAITLRLWIDGTLYAMVGTRGNVTFDLTASAIPYLRFELTGLFTVPTDTVQVSPTLTAFKKPLAVSKANTPTFQIDSTDLVMRKFMLNLGNAVETRFLVNEESIRITDRIEQLETTVEATNMATFNPYALAKSEDGVEIELAHGINAGNICTFTIPNAQMQRPAGLENAQNVVEWPLRLMPRPIGGNDQWKLTLT